MTTTPGSERSKDAMQILQLILPRKIISRIQAGHTLIADAHPNLVVLFSDIVDFTPLSSSMPTADMFKLLADLFTAFDGLADRFGVYKFETIGDAYLMVAGHDEDAMIHNRWVNVSNSIPTMGVSYQHYDPTLRTHTVAMTIHTSFDESTLSSIIAFSYWNVRQ